MPHKLVSSETVYEGRFVNIRVDKVAVPGGLVEREVVEESSDGVMIVPLTDGGKIVLVEQCRHLFGTTYEVPSGAINPGETPVEAAARELLEEACLTATSFELMSSHVNSVHMTGHNYYFLARGLAPGEGAICDMDEEFIGRSKLTFDEVERLIEEDRIPDLRNRGCIWLAQLRVLRESDRGRLKPGAGH